MYKIRKNLSIFDKGKEILTSEKCKKVKNAKTCCFLSVTDLLMV